MSSSAPRSAALPLIALACFLGATAPSARAETVSTRVFRVEEPARAGGEYQVLSTHDGRVYFVAPGDRELVAGLRALATRAMPARLVLDGDRVIAFKTLAGADASGYSDAFDRPETATEAAQALGSGQAPLASKSDDGFAGASLSERNDSDGSVDAPAPASLLAARAQGYQPTILGSMADAQSLFRSERELKHKSQCYERAHVWAREFQQSRGVQSMKVFIFFTKAFRERYTSRVVFWDRPYKWWFHVAPFVYVRDAQAQAEREVVLDREFLPQAVPMDDWTFQFIGKVRHDNRSVANPTREQARCLDATHYNQYWRNPAEPSYCVLRKVPMHYFQPLDVEALDCRPESENANNRPNAFLPDGRPKYPCIHAQLNGWRSGDLEQAYKHTKR